MSGIQPGYRWCRDPAILDALALILLSGGPGGEVAMMQPIAEELGKTCRCVLLEQRGTGRSRLTEYSEKTICLPAYFEDLEALRERLDREQVILLGNSWGMMLALAYGGAYPDRVQAIVTLGSGPIANEYGPMVGDNARCRLSLEQQEALRFWQGRRAQESQRAADEITKIALSAYFYDRHIGNAFVAGMPSGSVNAQVAQAARLGMNQTLTAFIRDKLADITARVLLVQGRQDVAPEQSVLEAHRLIRGSELHILEKCGHVPWVEQPEATWQLVHAFLARLP